MHISCICELYSEPVLKALKKRWYRNILAYTYSSKTAIKAANKLKIERKYKNSYKWRMAAKCQTLPLRHSSTSRLLSCCTLSHRHNVWKAQTDCEVSIIPPQTQHNFPLYLMDLCDVSTDHFSYDPTMYNSFVLQRLFVKLRTNRDRYRDELDF